MGLVWLVMGLVLFLGVHSVRIPGEQGRDHLIQKIGLKQYRTGYALVSLIGLVLIVVGYGQARLDPVFLWSPPAAMRHIAALLMLVSMIFLMATYVPRNHIKIKLKHPMTLAVKVWALAHLLSNGTLNDVLLFGGFLLWSVMLFKAARRRPAPVIDADNTATAIGTLMAVLVGIVVYLLFASVLHIQLIGVSPFSR